MPRASEQISCEDPKVSVIMVTYNHEKFVAQAIESVLMQETGFPVELVIGEDCSTDKTREIVQHYQQRYPNAVRTVLSTVNVGPNRNFAGVWFSCRSKYIAVVEGDDYWTNPTKLQKQVDFMDAHPECSMSFHNALISENNNPDEWIEYVPSHRRRTLRLEDVLTEYCIPSCSRMYRNGLIRSFIPGFENIIGLDWTITVQYAELGEIGCLDETMGVYRRHDGGTWSGLAWGQRCQHQIDMFGAMNRYLGGKYADVFRRGIAQYLYNLIGVYIEQGQQWQAWRTVWRCYLQDPVECWIKRQPPPLWLVALCPLLQDANSWLKRRARS